MVALQALALRFLYPASLMRSKYTIRKAGAVVLARCGPTFLTLTLLARMLLLADSKRKDLKSMDSSAPVQIKCAALRAASSPLGETCQLCGPSDHPSGVRV